MGRPVNAISFRLGFNKTWHSSWVSTTKHLSKLYIQKDFLLYEFIKNFFVNYTIPVFIDSVRNENKDLQQKTSGLDNLITNPFQTLTIVFSDVNINRGHLLNISCSFLDTVLVEWRFEISTKTTKNTSHSYFAPKSSVKRRISYFTDFKKINKFLNSQNKSQNRIRNKIKRKKRILIKLLFKRKKKNRWGKKFGKMKAILQQFKHLRLYPIHIFNVPRLKQKDTTRYTFVKLFKLLKVLLLMYEVVKNKNSPKVIYFLGILWNILQKLIGFNKNINQLLLKTIGLIRIKIITLNFVSQCFFKKLFNERYLIYLTSANSIFRSLYEIENHQPNMQLNFFGCHLRNISAALLINFITLKLGQYYSIQQILRPLLRELKSIDYLKGFKLIVAGRLTRQERAAYIVRQSGKFSLVTKSHIIDYAENVKILRFGAVGIKLWLHTSNLRPSFYCFKFTFL